MRFSAFIIIVSLLLQSCSASFNNWGRAPAAVADFEALVTKMQVFKSRMMGSEKDATCSKEQIDEDFKKLLASVKVNTCAVDNYSINREEFEEKACPKVKTAGYFDKVAKSILNEEKSKKNVNYFQNRVDQEFTNLIKEAQLLLKAVSAEVNNEKHASSERAALLAEYVENVLLPVRDVVVIMRSYLPQEYDGKKYYLELLPSLSPTFVQGLNEDGAGLITMGPNPKVSPFYLELQPLENAVGFKLAFSEAEIIKRDMTTLLKAPTAKNYILALKWMTLHMMLSQAYLYDIILGNQKDLDIPKSCQSHFNGNLPAKFKFFYEEGLDNRIVENILLGHGLSYRNDDLTYTDYYLDNINKDPTKDRYSGLVPFENFKSALISMEDKLGKPAGPQFDDIEHFQAVFSFKVDEAQRVFFGQVNKQNVKYAGFETFQKLIGHYSLDEIASVKVGDDIQQIYPGKLNLSPYLFELMQMNGFVDYSQLITEKMRKKFEGKKSVIDFPAMYASPIWRDWSLRLLADTFYEHKDAPSNSDLANLLRSTCLFRGGKEGELGKICNGNVVQNLSNYLAEFRSGENYVPTRRLEEKKFKEVYPYLSMIWVVLRDNLNLLPDAKPFELNFLLDQMSAGNPWARLKFSYMVALDQLEYQREGIQPKYDRKNFYTDANHEAICSANNVAFEYNKLVSAGKILGLDKALNYAHSESILSNKEKKEVWKKIYDSVQQKNYQLFSVKNQSRNYYQDSEDLTYKTILTKKDALATGIRVTPKALEEIEKVSQTTEAKLGEFFLQLYKLHDVEKQKELFEEFSKKNKIDNDFQVKLNFLALDQAYKKPIHKDLLKQAAQTRKIQIVNELDRFCKMDVNDEVEFKHIFYSTTKAQNELNEMAGLPSVPPEVMKKIGEMTESEWRDMKWGIGAGLVQIAAGVAVVAVGGGCTLLSGGLCAPLALAGLGAIGIQVKLTSNELERKAQADVAEGQVKHMEELGFANTGSSDEVHRSYLYATFEAISILPITQIASRSSILGPKLMRIYANSLLKQTGETAFKAASKSAKEAEEVRAAYYEIGFASVSSNLGVDAKALEMAMARIGKVKKLYTSGEIDWTTMTSKVLDILAPIKRAKIAFAKTVQNEVGNITVKKTVAEIDARTAERMSDYFADNPKEMLRVIQGYSGERLTKAMKVMNEMKATDRIGKRIPIYSAAKDWFLRMRNEKLALNAEKILRIEKELLKLGTNRGQLKDYISKNIDDLTDIFIEIPMRKREIPYFIFAQGMPEFNFIKGRKIPFLSMMSEGQSLKRMVTARARLVLESYKAQARGSFKLKRYVQSNTAFVAFKGFQNAVARLANMKIGKESAEIMREYRALEEELTQKLHGKFIQSGQAMDYKVFKELIFNPTTLKERATAEAIWESVPAEELLGLKNVGTYAHKIAEGLSKNSDMESYEGLLNSLKIITINKNAAVLDVM